MKYFTILPDSYSSLLLLEQYSPPGLMCLAQHLSSELYRNIVQKAFRQGVSLMLDNGAAEAEMLPWAAVLEHVVLMRNRYGVTFQHITMPDVLHNARATSTLFETNINTLPSWQQVIIPHGDDVTTWVKCMNDMLTTAAVNSKMYPSLIGIPKYFEQYEKAGGRNTLSSVYRDISIPMHAYGLYGNPIMEVRKMKKWVSKPVSFDSGAAIAWAQVGVPLHTLGRHSLGMTAPFDVSLAIQNIKTLQWEATC